MSRHLGFRCFPQGQTVALVGLYVSASGNDHLTQAQMAHGQGDEGQRVRELAQTP